MVAEIRNSRDGPSLAFVAIGFFIVLASFGITNSSIGIGRLNADAGMDSGVVAGAPRPIRTDEYLRATTWRLGTSRRSAEEYKSPLALDSSYAISAKPNGGIAETVVFLDAAELEVLGPVLPERFVFSLYRWLPTIIVLLALPACLQKVGIRRGIAWLATLLIILTIFFVWTSVNMSPEIRRFVPGLNRVQPLRLAEIVGVPEGERGPPVGSRGAGR